MADKKVLIVANAGFTRIQAEKAMSGMDCEFHHADSGRAAILFLTGQPCDLVVTEFMMPEMDGLSLFRKVLTGECFKNAPDRPCPPFILLTSHFKEQIEEVAQKLGFVGVAEKGKEDSLLREYAEKSLEGGPPQAYPEKTEDTPSRRILVSFEGPTAKLLDEISVRCGAEVEEIVHVILNSLGASPLWVNNDSVDSLQQSLNALLNTLPHKEKTEPATATENAAETVPEESTPAEPAPETDSEDPKNPKRRFIQPASRLAS